MDKLDRKWLRRASILGLRLSPDYPRYPQIATTPCLTKSPDDYMYGVGTIQKSIDAAKTERCDELGGNKPEPRPRVRDLHRRDRFEQHGLEFRMEL